VNDRAGSAHSCPARDLRAPGSRFHLAGVTTHSLPRHHSITLRGDHIAEEFMRILDDYVESHYPARPVVAEPAGV
jgi:hypothetical protein